MERARGSALYLSSWPVWLPQRTVYNNSMTDLTPRQARVLRFIQRSLGETGMPPTRAEIAAELGFRSPNAAEEHLRVLARKGVIQLLPGASRGIGCATPCANSWRCH
jgi:repressor LexA